MAAQPSSDAAIYIVRVCRHALWFRYAAQIQLEEFTRARPGAAKQPKAQLRQHVQVASPPPKRHGQDWWRGIYLDDGTTNGRPFDPADDIWKQHRMVYLEGIPSLDQPSKDTIVLNASFNMTYEPGLQAPLRDEVDPKGFLSVPYYTRIQLTSGIVTYVDVNYSGEYRARWPNRPLDPEVDKWVAISIADQESDCFSPPERDTAEVIAQVEDCYRFPRPHLAPAVQDERPDSAPQGQGEGGRPTAPVSPVEAVEPVEVAVVQHVTDR
jgi:hypothetical protein